MDVDEILYGHYAIGNCRKIILFNFLQLGNTNIAGEQTCEVLRFSQWQVSRWLFSGL
jgi:hypothetical protein